MKNFALIALILTVGSMASAACEQQIKQAALDHLTQKKAMGQLNAKDDIDMRGNTAILTVSANGGNVLEYTVAVPVSAGCRTGAVTVINTLESN